MTLYNSPFVLSALGDSISYNFDYGQARYEIVKTRMLLMQVFFVPRKIHSDNDERHRGEYATM